MSVKPPIADYIPSHGSHSFDRGVVINVDPVHGAHSRRPDTREAQAAIEADQMTMFDVVSEGPRLLDGSPNEEGGCQHIHLLTPLPSVADAFKRAKRLKSVSLPWLPAGFVGEHPRLGKFVIDENNCDSVEWNLIGGEVQVGSLNELSFNPSKAPMRLQLGWLISAIHELEGIHIADGIPDPAEAVKERSRWGRKAATYLKWGVAPVDKLICN